MNLKLKNDRRESKTNASGITLIALVVTIVVLLILAGISLNLVLGSNGIIAKAKDAKNKTEQDKINTETALNNLYDDIVEAEGGSSNGGSSGSGSGSGGTTYTWKKMSFVATYTKDENPNTSGGEKNVAWCAYLCLSNALCYNNTTHQISDIQGCIRSVHAASCDLQSEMKQYPFMKEYCFICGSIPSGGWILAYQGCDITDYDTTYCTKQTKFAKIPMNTTLTISKGTYEYGTVTSTDPRQYPDDGMYTDGYWYVKQ